MPCFRLRTDLFLKLVLTNLTNVDVCKSRGREHMPIFYEPCMAGSQIGEELGDMMLSAGSSDSKLLPIFKVAGAELEGICSL